MPSSLIARLPESVEEAGALLGATITQCGKQLYELKAAPDRMHSSFAITHPVPSQELLDRLYSLRALLRSEAASHDIAKSSLSAAPSLLQVLKKLIGISTQLAAVSAQAELNSVKVSNAANPINPRIFETPPLLSVPLRTLWVECVVLCHRLGDSSKTDTIQFVRQMLVLAVLNPRAQKASGGVRIAALEVISGLFADDHGHLCLKIENKTSKRTSLAQQLSPWSLDILSVCLRALRSAGNGEPSYRVSAVRAACATAIACRQAHLEKLERFKNDETSDVPTFWLKGAMEDKAIHESIKIINQAITDKFHEVRRAAATLASLLAPMLVLSGTAPGSSGSSAIDDLACLDEVFNLATKNLDDESPFVADGWCEALARCLSTSIQFNKQIKVANANDSSQRNAGLESDAPRRFGGTRKTILAITSMSNLQKVVKYLVDQYVKVGGELSANRAGGPFSSGGRAVRLGYCQTLIKLLQLQRIEIGESRTMSSRQALLMILGMIGNETDNSLKPPSAQEIQGPILFGNVNRTWSRADAGLNHITSCRVLREGFSEMMPEPAQIVMFQELIRLLPSKDKATGLNGSQVQVILVEVSHLLATLGEVITSNIDDAVDKICVCLSDANHGVRHQAAITLVALTSSFPAVGKKLLSTCIEEINKLQVDVESLLKLNHTEKKPTTQADQPATRSVGMFRRSGSSISAGAEAKKGEEMYRPYQYEIHGKTLFVSILIKELPFLPVGLPMDAIQQTLSTAERLVSSQFKSALMAANKGVVVSCVRSGFCIVSGILTTGPNVVGSIMPTVFDMWQKACKAAKEGNKNWSAKYDIHTLDAVLTSIVAFLKYCSELLLTIPDALNRLTIMLEDVMELIKPAGRLGSLPPSIQLVARLESARASLFEAFTWLPSGSFPIVADIVFAMSVDQIREAIEDNVSCSILPSLVAKEDAILDAKTLSRAKNEGDTGGARDIEETILTLSAEIAQPSEREAVIHLRSRACYDRIDKGNFNYFRESVILQHYASDDKTHKVPTPLHSVGTWRRPFDPSCASKVRLVDAAIQAFSATFGLKDGQQQDSAMAVLDSLVPPALAHLAKSIGINSVVNEPEKRLKTSDDSAAATNITAVLLSCLQALPLHESTHNIPIGLGPPWMNKAKDLFLTFLPVHSTIVRRASAEGLSLLATLGVTEDAHFLQSTVLHSLDEVMRGYKADGKPKAITLEHIAAARAGSLLTLACIQRASFNIKTKQLDRARGRASGGYTEKVVDKKHENLPILQMMTRILPSVSCAGPRDYFVVRTYALHAFVVLLAYSSRLEMEPMGVEDKQLLLKGVEVIEDNFTASWTAASVDIDKGQEADKMMTEAAFLSVLLRLMTFLIPYIHKISSNDGGIFRRFSRMATMILESHGSHPTVAVESMAFLEVVARQQELLSPAAAVNDAFYTYMPCILSSLTPNRLSLFGKSDWEFGYVPFSNRTIRSAIEVVNVLSMNQIDIIKWSGSNVISALFASLEILCASRSCSESTLFRCVAASRVSESFFNEAIIIESEIFTTVCSLVTSGALFNSEYCNRCVRWILLSRHLLSGTSTFNEDSKEEFSRDGVIASALAVASLDTRIIYDVANPVRSSAKCLASHLSVAVMDKLLEGYRDPKLKMYVDPHFDIDHANKMCAKLCSGASTEKNQQLPSSLIFHLEDVLSSACMSCVASIDQSEIRALQESSIHLLARIIQAFGPFPDPENPSVSILDQYSTQIFASIRHSLSGTDGLYDDSTSRLFVGGCEALFAAIKAKLTSDPATIKRLLRLAVPSATDIPFFHDSSPSIESAVNGKQGTVDIVVRCAKIWTCGRILLDPRLGDFDDILSEFFKDQVCLGIHLATIALDGVRILYGSGYSLVGNLLGNKDSRRMVPFDSGFNFESYLELNQFTKQFFKKAWSSCARCGIRALLSGFKEESVQGDRKQACSFWLKSLVPLMFSGIHESIKPTNNLDSTGWCFELDDSLVLLDSLVGLSSFLQEGPESVVATHVMPFTEKLILLLEEDVIMPILTQGKQNKPPSSMRTRTNPDVITEVCNLLCHLAELGSLSIPQDSALLRCLLRPLNLMQTKSLNFEEISVDIIVVASLKGMSSLIQNGKTPDIVVRAMVHLTLTGLNRSENIFPATINAGLSDLLVECLKKDVLILKEKQDIACDLVSSGNWVTWSVLPAIEDGVLVVKSFENVRKLLRDKSDMKNISLAIQSILGVLQRETSQNPIVGTVFYYLGEDILSLLYLYGIGEQHDASRRLILCGDLLKTILIAYQLCLTESDSGVMSSFMSSVFPVFLAIIRFNGLPSHPSPEKAGDIMLGRMCAQAILHSARTDPNAFKECVGMLSEVDRTLLEFSIRAEMTGYATTQQVPEKKKLIVTGFRK